MGMKYRIEFELPDNEVVIDDIKVTPIDWAYHGYSGRAKATPVELSDDYTYIAHGDNNPKPVLLRDDGEYCPNCSTINSRVLGLRKLQRGTSYCPYCGQRVIWK